MLEKKYDFVYTMSNVYGDEVTIYGHDGGTAYADFYDWGREMDRRKSFPGGEVDAYEWAMRHGFRE